MRRAKYDCKKVICPNATCIGGSSNVAKPGYWLTFKDGNGEPAMGRVLGRIAEAGAESDVRGHLAVVRLGHGADFAGIAWVSPADVMRADENPPARLLAWLTGDEWVKDKNDIARIVAMHQHGTLSERYIENRHDPEAPYNSRPAYVAQFILE